MLNTNTDKTQTDQLNYGTLYAPRYEEAFSPKGKKRPHYEEAFLPIGKERPHHKQTMCALIPSTEYQRV